MEVVERVRAAWPTKPLLVRISAAEYAEGPEKDGDDWKQWGVEQSIMLCKKLQALGVDLIDCSSGGNWSLQKIPLSPGYQVRSYESIV